MWARSAATTRTAAVTLDLDASLVEIHSEHKDGTGPTYKGGFGFHPMFCFADATGEALSGLLRPGNAVANSIEDHLAVLDTAIDQLPAWVAAGHRPGDDPSSVARALRVRADSAACSATLAAGFWERNVGFLVTARSSRAIAAAISRVVDDGETAGWVPALGQDGNQRDRAAVIEVTDLVDLSGWPAGTRLIVRREPLHPGAQTSLFPSLEFRYWGHYTDQAGDPAVLDADMRAHAHVEDHIRRLKASGLERFPFANLDANRAWMASVCLAADLVRWFQLLCLTGPIAAAEPKTLRWALWHTPGRLVRLARRHVVRLLEHWPTTPDLLDAYGRIATIT
ncbi:IS1380 family transposase [Aciditerrimonas ferrireducens]|uniref:IS1380 family transposase n=1 Tax=Aciditerrimonas ferrireducens TaxID=667306 RepID=UPI0035E3DEA2